MCYEFNDIDFIDVCMCVNLEYVYNLFYGKLMEKYDKCLFKVSIRGKYISIKKILIIKVFLSVGRLKISYIGNF